MRVSGRGRGGLTLATLSGATFGTSGSFASSLIASGWSPGAAVTARVAIGAVLLTAPALAQLRSLHMTRRAGLSLLLYGALAVAGAQLCYFNAVAHLSVAVALLLEYSGILLVVAWGWARQGRRPGRLTLLGSAAALAGLVLVLDLVGATHRADLAGVLWGLGAAVGLAVYFVIASATDGALPPLVVAWGGLAVGAAVLGLAAVLGVLPVRVTTDDVTLFGRHVSWIVPVLGLSVVAGVVAYLAGIAAARRLGARLASFAGLGEVIFAVLFAWLLVGQRLDAVQLAGGAALLTGIALVRLDETSGAVTEQRPVSAATPPHRRHATPVTAAPEST